MYPALAVAERLRERGYTTLWLGTRRGLEGRLVPECGCTLLEVHATALRGGGFWRRLSAAVRSGWALMQSLWFMLRYRPAVALGMGGYVSAPGGIAAWLLRVPLCVHEQNAVPGLVNRLLARRAAAVMQAYAGTFPDGIRAVTTGNPVRRSICELPPPAPRRDDDKDLHLLVLGGSQGADALNRILPDTARNLAVRTRDVRLLVRHQSGRAGLEETRAAYARLAITARVEAYIEDMADAYRWADLAICRAGALTLAELCAAGLGAILVPYPYAADDHQTVNARRQCALGAAVLLSERELSVERLARQVVGLSSRARMFEMARYGRGAACPDAAERVAEICVRQGYG